MKQTEYSVKYMTGETVTIFASLLYDAMVLACADRIKEGKNHKIESITDVDRGHVYSYNNHAGISITFGV